MPSTPEPESRRSTGEREAEVKEGLELMKRVIASVAKGRLDDSEILSVAHDCWIEFARTRARERVDNPKGLQSTIAWRRALRALRRKKVDLERLESSGAREHEEAPSPREITDSAPGPEAGHDRADELAFFVQAVLALSKERCRERFRALLEFDYNREVAAESMGEVYNSFVQGLNRCIKSARQILDEDDGPLGRQWREIWGQP